MSRDETRSRLREGLRRRYERRQHKGGEREEPDLIGELERVDTVDRELLVSLAECLLEELDRYEPAVAEVNHALHVLFEFFQIRDLARIRPAVERAVLHPAFRSKARYLQLLEELADPRSVPALIEVLSRHRGTSEDDLDGRVAALEALRMQAEPLQELSPVLALLDDSSSRVRLAATAYVWTHHVSEAGDILVRRIAYEDDPDVLALALETVEQLGRVDALPVCEERLSRLDPALSDFIEPLQATIAVLREQR